MTNEKRRTPPVTDGILKKHVLPCFLRIFLLERGMSLRERNELKFFGVLPKADGALAVAWWVALILRGVLPAAFAIAMGVLVGAVQRGDRLAGPLTFAGAVFILLQVLAPIHQAV